MLQKKFGNLTVTTTQVSKTMSKVVVRHEPTEIEVSRQNTNEGQATHEAVIDVVNQVKESGEDL
jgi:hypothetical protein